MTAILNRRSRHARRDAESHLVSRFGWIAVLLLVTMCISERLLESAWVTDWHDPATAFSSAFLDLGCVAGLAVLGWHLVLAMAAFLPAQPAAPTTAQPAGGDR